MNAPFPTDLLSFHQFVAEKMSSGSENLSPEEVLDQRRTLHPAPGATDPEDLAAIQEAIDDMEAGDKGVPFADFDREFRARHNLPPQSLPHHL
jgi:hypothetical protein